MQVEVNLSKDFNYFPKYHISLKFLYFKKLLKNIKYQIQILKNVVGFFRLLKSPCIKKIKLTCIKKEKVSYFKTATKNKFDLL